MELTELAVESRRGGKRPAEPTRAVQSWFGYSMLGDGAVGVDAPEALSPGLDRAAFDMLAQLCSVLGPRARKASVCGCVGGLQVMRRSW